MTATTFTRPSATDDEVGVPIPFRPQDYADCVAVVLEPKCKQMTRYDGRARLEIVARLTVFETIEEIEQDDPADVIELVVTWGRIASLLNRALVDGTPVAACIGQDQPTQAHGTRPWRLNDLDRETEVRLARWLIARDTRG